MRHPIVEVKEEKAAKEEKVARALGLWQMMDFESARGREKVRKVREVVGNAL